MAMVTGGELVVRTLERAGVTHLFGIHGAHLETIFQGCRQHGLTLIDTRHEVAAGHAAEGYARAQRALGVAMGTAGPGFTNLLTSVTNAYLDRTPVLYLAGSAGLAQAETNTLQAGFDQVAMAAPVTKWAHRVGVTADLPRLTAQAIRIALAEPMGPVLLDLPMDVLAAKVDEELAPVPQRILFPSPALPPPQLVNAALELLTRAQRPVILAGAGAWYAHAEEALRAFAEHAGIPVFSDFQAHGLLPASHALYGGTFHKLADFESPGERPDVVLALGMRFGLFTLGASGILVPREARLIHADTDAREIGRLREVEVGIVADPRETLAALLAQAGSRSWPDFSTWQHKVQEAGRARRERLAAAAADAVRAGAKLHPYHVVAALAASLPPDALVIGDGAESYHWLNEVIRQEQPGSYLTHGFLGAVGHGLGLSLGAKVAHPGRPVLCLAGDGAVGFTLAELDTMVRLRLPIVVVVMNNRSWGASQHFQEMVSGKDRLIGTQLTATRYDEVAAAFGCHAAQVTRQEELRPALEAAFGSGRPALVNVLVDLEPPPPELALLARR